MREGTGILRKFLTTVDEDVIEPNVISAILFDVSGIWGVVQPGEDITGGIWAIDYISVLEEKLVFAVGASVGQVWLHNPS